jgi:hypothetical protein
VTWSNCKHKWLLCKRLEFESCVTRILMENYSSFLPQIIIVFSCTYICKMSYVNFYCKQIWFSVIAAFTMSSHSCVICAFEINKWFIIITGLNTDLIGTKVKFK